jgi:Phage terminase large subunit (GpA)/LAGLIDADG-like domain
MNSFQTQNLSTARFIWQDFTADRPTQSPSEWAEKEVIFNEQEVKGRCDFTGRNYLRRIIDDNWRIEVKRQTVVTGTGVGKALALDTPIPTPFGWKTMGSLKVGDYLYAPNGKITHVTFATDVMRNRKCYEVLFSDGSKIVADAEHLWETVKTKRAWIGAKEIRSKKEKWIGTTEELRKTLFWRVGKPAHCIEVCKPVEGLRRKLLIHPYILGVWLGDGDSSGPTLTYGKADREIRKHIAECGIEVGYERFDKRSNSIRASLDRAGSRWEKNRLCKNLKNLNLKNNKHIPEIYLNASAAKRWELLQGLMDTDGCVGTHGRCEFTSCLKTLAYGVLELALSLGLKAKIKKSKSKLNGRVIGDKFRITFCADNSQPIFKLSRKQNRLRHPSEIEQGKRQRGHRTIIAVTPCKSVPVRCIQVFDSSHCFLAGRTFIKTHNTLTYIVGIMWKLKFKPCRGIMVFPAAKGEGGAGNFADTRLIKDIEATPCLRDMIPEGGQRRFLMNKQFVKLGGAHFGFVGGNSAGQLGSNRCADVRMDETDKFPDRIKNEAGTGDLVRNRTEGVVESQIFETSTPTVEGGIIWPALMASNLHYYFLPCPRCNPKAAPIGKNFKGWFVLAWNEQFSTGLITSILHTPIPYAYLRWDKKAKGKDGIWNFEKVQETAHMVCPHCEGRIYDYKDGKVFNDDKNWIDKHGEWICVKLGVPSHVGYHASSLYAPAINVESTWGGRAVKFLAAVEKGSVQDFINSTLALPNVGQGDGLMKVEPRSESIAQEDWIPMLTADFQKNYPYIWFIVRKWCAFKLLPAFSMVDGKPEFYELLHQPGNEDARKRCEALIDGKDEVWPVVLELMRFDSRTGVSPLVDFLIARKIVGHKLLKLYEQAGNRTMEFRAAIFKEMKKPVSRGGDSELMACGYLSLSGEYVWEELKDIATEFHVGKGISIPNRCIGIDTGYAEKFNREVLRKCFESATVFKYYDPTSRNRPPLFFEKPIHVHCQPCPMDGWLGMKGYRINQRWNHNGVMSELNMSIDDPFFGTPEAGKAVTEVLEFPMGLFWLRKDDIRRKRSKLNYSIAPNVQLFPRVKNADGEIQMEKGQPISTFKLADYEKHLNEQYFDKDKAQVIARHGKGGMQGRMYPYHLDDCENMQIALAFYHEFFSDGEKEK